MKKVFLWIGLILLAPILLFVVLAVLLYLPPVQNWAVQRAAAYASEQTGLDISVGRVSLVFPLDLGAERIMVLQPRDSLPQVSDTVAAVERLVLDVRLRPLLSGKVVVNALELDGTRLNTTNLIAAAHVKGSFERLAVRSRGIDLAAQTVTVDDALLSGARMTVELNDTAQADTTSSETLWRIYIDKVALERTGVTLRLPGDTLQAEVYMGLAEARGGVVDLGRGLYSADSFTWTGGTLGYDNLRQPSAEGLDPNHIALTGIDIGIDSIYYCAPEMRLALRRMAMRERSGLEVTQMTGGVTMSATQLLLPSLTLRTPDSDVEACVEMDLNALDSINPGRVSLRLLASVGKQDVMRFCGGMPQQFVRRYPDRPITVRGTVEGNMQRADITGLQVSLPTAFSLSADGYAENPTDIDRLKADIKVKAQAHDIAFVTALAGLDGMGGLTIPQGIRAEGRLQADRQRYTADVTLHEGRGTVKADGTFDAKAMAYKAKVAVDGLDLHHFMPHDSLRMLTAQAEVEGRGTDMLSPRTRLDAKARVGSLQYGSWNLDSMSLSAQLRDGRAYAHLVCRNELMEGTVTADALVDTRRIEATVGTDLRKADLYRLRLMDSPFTAGMCAHVDLASDMKQYYMLKGYLNDFTIRTATKTFRPADLEVDMLTRTDTTWAKVTSGSLNLYMTASGGYESLISQGQRLADEALAQMKNKVIDQPRLREMLPTMSLRLTSGGDNPAANFLRFKGVTFKDLYVDLNMSPEQGLNGDMHLYSLIADSTRIDTVRMHVYQDQSNVRFSGLVQNNRRNPQFVFKALIDGSVLERGTELNVRYYDGADQLGLMLGTRAEMCDSGIQVRLQPERPTLGYKEFNLNRDNYIFLGRDKKIRAHVDLVADDGTGVKVYSDEQSPDMLQDLTVSLNQFDLEKITSVVPYAPRISGLLNGDFHVMQDGDERLSMVSDMYVTAMTYEGCRMGNIGSEFAYLQQEDSAHFVEGTLSCDGREIGVLRGTYRDVGEGYLNATFSMARFPLSMVNGFIPDQMAGLMGYAEGSLAVKGPLSRPKVDGEVLLDSSYLVSVPYGVTLRFDDDPVRIVGSNLLFENFTVYAYNDNPLTIAGNVDFSDTDRINMSMRMRASDFQIINAKQTRGSVAYGKAFVNFYGSLVGTTDDLQMRGKLDVLGKTDMTYVLEDSPLNSDDRLKELVTFTDFSDTTQVQKVSRPAIGGLDMLLMMNIEQGAHIFCALNENQSNYVNLEGGGELRMTYSAADNMQLFGRYTINSGEMKYSLPIIPLKTFTIKEGSYIEFTGDMMNPRLNLTAIEEVKAMVGSESGASRSVQFECGVKVTKTLSDMGLEFTLSAPEDMTMTNELAAMSAEDRGKSAVLMLSTGMYIADGNTSKFSMNSALNSFLQNEINSIAGSALRTVDLSLGLDQSSDATGNTYTDYSFKFAKRFWNNRVNFVIGGKLSDNSSDATATEQDQTFIDNVSLEYRIDQTAMRYVRLFYNKEANDLLEGRISEYGAGFVWRKKADRFWQLFNFRSTDASPARRPAAVEPTTKDTIRTDEDNK